LNEKAATQNITETILQITAQKKPATVSQLVELVKEKTPASNQEILDAIIKLQNEGKLQLGTPPQQALRMSTYLGTPGARWYWITMALTVATAIVVFTVPETAFPLVYMRYVLGTIFILWLPGYAFIKALFPQHLPFTKGLAHTLETSQKNLDMIEHIALSLGMSLALVPIVGLLLNYTPWGIRLTPIVLSLLALTTIFATAALIREYQTRPTQQPPQ
jgi:hypothetical protein